MLRNLFVFFILSINLSACQSISTQSTALTPDINTPVKSVAKVKPVVVLKKPIQVASICKHIDTKITAEKPVTVIIKPQIIMDQVQAEPDPIIVDDIWARLRKGMKLPPADNKRIAVQRDWYIKHKDYLQRVMVRAKPLLHYILNEIDKKGLPSELALLPIVESAFQTYAYSHGRASGIWQIIPSTGRYLGLNQDWWYDGRRDLFLSTTAALNYLDILSKQFKGDDVLALASYNAGPGKIRSAIRYNKKKNRPTDFWSLSKIRPETRDYVPKLYALKQIFSDPEKYGVTLIDIPDEPGFEVVSIKKQIDIAKAAELCEMSLDEFYTLNPAFNNWATPPKGEHHFLLPIGKKEIFEKNYAQLPASEHIKWVRHKIKKGETLSQIAVTYNTRISLIKSVNKIRKNNIRAGKHLMIPTSTQSLHKYGKSSASRLAITQNRVRGKNKMTHIVKKGDSLWTIARRYKVSHKSLAKWNGMAPIDTLKLGRKLVIWNSSNNKSAKITKVSFKSPQSRLQKLRYTVRKGDSVARIASKFNVSINDIKRWNKVGKYIQPGQKLKIWVDVTIQSS